MSADHPNRFERAAHKGVQRAAVTLWTTSSDTLQEASRKLTAIIESLDVAASEYVNCDILVTWIGEEAVWHGYVTLQPT